jgi:serine protease Do
LAESFAMDRPYGALVSKVIADSPSEKAGLQIGDVIVEFDGHEIDTSSELPPVVGMTAIGEKVKVKIIRNGRQKIVKVVIGLLSDDEPAIAKVAAKKALNRLAIVVSNLTSEQRERLDIPALGVLVQQVKEGPASKAGIQQGDVILRIQNNVVRGVADFDKMVKELPAGQSVAILIQRRGSPVFLALKIK